MTDWFDKIPVYDGGTTAEGFYNCGPMLADDRKGPTDEDTVMKLVTGTTAEEFAAYGEKLAENGFTAVFSNSTPAAECVQWVKDGIHLYGVFNRMSGEVRLFADPAGVTADRFGYTAQGGKTEIYQYGLYYDPQNGHSPTTTNCGMLYIVKLADNSLFMMDGGHILQCSVEAVTGLYDFLHRITGKAPGETIPIACWFVTHAHDDHLAMCVRLTRTYPGEFDIQRILFNFPSYSVCRRGYAEEPFRLRETLREFYPDALTLKPHHGMKFTLASTEFEVYYTHEDVIRADNVTAYPFRDFNCTSTVLKMTADGGSVMWLGDTNLEAEAHIVKTMPREMWKADVVQVAHHCFNHLSTLYPWIGAPYAMLPNSYFGGHTPDNISKLADVEACLKSPDCIWYEEKTTGFVFADGEYRVILEEDRVGGEHDGIGLYGTYTERILE